jgi:gamma-glutamylputrescine oxidase
LSLGNLIPPQVPLAVGALTSLVKMSAPSYWLRARGPDYPPLEGDQRATVAVVGGGITGCAAALFLAEQGIDVVLLERGAIASGASGRNGGFVLAGTVEDFATAVDNFGLERATAIWSFSVDNLALVERLAARLADSGTDTGYRRCGSLRLADSPEEARHIEESAKQLARIGYEIALRHAHELPPPIRHLYSCGAYNPLDGEYDPAAFVRGLAATAAVSGARIHAQTPAEAIVEEGDAVVVTTPSGPLRAEHAVVCLNAYSAALLPTLAPLLRPVRGQALVTGPLTERLFDVPCYGHHGYHWWRQLPDGKLLAGGWRNESFDTEECDDEVACDPVQGHIGRFVEHIAPGASIEQRWAGLMGFTPDGLPLVGRLPGSERTWIAGGYNGHGNGLALKSAMAVTVAICGRPSADLDLFDPARSSVSPGVRAE